MEPKFIVGNKMQHKNEKTGKRWTHTAYLSSSSLMGAMNTWTRMAEAKHYTTEKEAKAVIGQMNRQSDKFVKKVSGMMICTKGHKKPVLQWRFKVKRRGENLRSCLCCIHKVEGRECGAELTYMGLNGRPLGAKMKRKKKRAPNLH